MSGGEPGTRRRWIAGLAGISVIAAVAVAFGVFGVHTLFVDEEVSEAGPVFASDASDSSDGSDGTDGVDASDASEAPAPSEAPEAADPAAPVEPVAPTEPAAPAAPAVREASSGTFTAVDHPGEGAAVVLTDGAQSFVRFEDDFATDNGPDLYVRVTVGGREVELGPLKGNVGAQNYELPADIDPDAIEQVSVWCKRFDSTFTTARLT